MQTDTRFKTSDGYYIYGTLGTVDSTTLLVFIHGITGSPNEHQYFNAEKYFNKQEFDTFRFSFYARKDDARPMPESSIATHVKDLQVVIDNFKDKYEKLVLIGHSLGALVIMNSDLSVISKLVIWDPSSGFSDPKDKNIDFLASIDKYILRWGKEMLVSKEMIEEWKNIDIEELAKKISLPTKFIFAGDKRKYNIWKSCLSSINSEVDHTVIPNSTHVFVEEGAEEMLFAETLKWLV